MKMREFFSTPEKLDLFLSKKQYAFMIIEKGKLLVGNFKKGKPQVKMILNSVSKETVSNWPMAEES